MPRPGTSPNPSLKTVPSKIRPTIRHYFPAINTLQYPADGSFVISCAGIWAPGPTKTPPDPGNPYRIYMSSYWGDGIAIPEPDKGWRWINCNKPFPCLGECPVTINYLDTPYTSGQDLLTGENVSLPRYDLGPYGFTIIKVLR